MQITENYFHPQYRYMWEPTNLPGTNYYFSKSSLHSLK